MENEVKRFRGTKNSYKWRNKESNIHNKRKTSNAR